jgi:hypothetical protein
MSFTPAQVVGANLGTVFPTSGIGTASDPVRHFKGLPADHKIRELRAQTAGATTHKFVRNSCRRPDKTNE